MICSSEAHFSLLSSANNQSQRIVADLRYTQSSWILNKVSVFAGTDFMSSGIIGRVIHNELTSLVIGQIKFYFKPATILNQFICITMSCNETGTLNMSTIDHPRVFRGSAGAPRSCPCSVS